ncbi:hypothetical protein [Roseomonas xinghualingensis]|uniref:hypothetical protein n=1 Tax=Roseomonas xinghualingensis TaxID=2986475 RepID=UPI0021F1CB87|nr:hypothetical protein [Roseomonas sp. SXEYE001]MCV4210287.1 hypothetical protein [Roseomonas sp. SXEYE001]
MVEAKAAPELVERILQGAYAQVLHKIERVDGTSIVGLMQSRRRGKDRTHAIAVIPGVLNRANFGQIVTEAQQHGVANVRDIIFFCRTCTYNGDGMTVAQIGEYVPAEMLADAA